MKLSLKQNLILLFVAFLVALLLIWSIFYIVISNFIYEQTKNQVDVSILQITDELLSEFIDIEQLCYAQQNSISLHNYFMSDDTIEKFSYAGTLDAEIEGQYNSAFVSDIIAIDIEGSFYRIYGNLSNSSAQLLSRQVSEMSLPSNIIVSTQGEIRLGYAVASYDETGSVLGYFVILTSADKLYTLLQSYHLESYLSIALLSADEVIMSSDNYIPTSDTSLSVTKQLGLTQFKLICAVDEAYLSSTIEYLPISAIWTVIFSSLALWICIRIFQKLFLRPMLHIMDNAKEIATSKSETQLSHTGQIEFDELVDEINTLILQLEERTQATFTLERTIQTVELERRNAIITSLKKQINAHFTVNTLTIIRRLNQLGETEKVGKLCDGLAYLLRYAHDGDELISCMDELFVLEKYITMMQIRYPNRFESELYIESDIEDLHIPRMLIQPIIENAIVHGFANSTGHKLKLYGRPYSSGIEFLISDDGCGISQNTLKNLRDSIEDIEANSHFPNGLEQIALLNIQKRIITDFGEGYGVSIDSKLNEGTCVRLYLPM